MNAAVLIPMMRNGRRSAFRARAASHCVIVAAGVTDGGRSGVSETTGLVRRQHGVTRTQRDDAPPDPLVDTGY